MDRNSCLKFLNDSGSKVSIIPKSIFRKPRLSGRLTLHAANLYPIKTYGTHDMALNLGLRRVFIWPFIIVEMSTPIIGADLLSDTGLLVDIRNKKLIDSVTKLCAAGTLSLAKLYSISAVLSLSTPGPFSQAYDTLLRTFMDIAAPDSTTASLRDLPIKHSIVTTGPPVFKRPR
ncbi:uncharacterized protein LOC111643854 [Copidosoma floridanum]|uniref:uncharacterized protein LOC106646565 n=1 Tax=Copidosoma floridanum TaxID=29053 RepID=UPI0006C9B5B5|nr:uncharacterized protein LOC106646565 [Copidosoma floridanum]XP_023247881.1 uncharacterized protein LOC111643854 [Copidosoma floridanum]